MAAFSLLITLIYLLVEIAQSIPEIWPTLRRENGLTWNAFFMQVNTMQTGQKTPLDSLLEQITSALPAGWQDMREELDRNLHTALRSALTRLDLVTREEFEIQRDVLARTRAQCDALAAQVAELEKQLLNK